MQIQQTLDALETTAREMIETAQSVLDAVAIERAALSSSPDRR